MRSRCRCIKELIFGGHNGNPRHRVFRVPLELIGTVFGIFKGAPAAQGG